MKTVWYSSIILISSLSIATQKGLVIVPVADLVGQPLVSTNPHIPITDSYQQLSWSARGSDYAACPRIHQLLFHEQVDILENTKDEVRIKIPNVFYQQTTRTKAHNEYWTLRSNIIPLDELQKKGIDVSTIPLELCFSARNHDTCYKNSVVLIKPYYDPITCLTLSVGTRFIKTKKQIRKKHVTVYCFNPNTMTMQTIAIPQTNIYEWKPKPFHERINDFVSILKQWTHQMGTLPYLWGGCSFTDTHPSNSFHIAHKTIQGQKLGYYKRPDDAKRSTKTGFDCSNIIVRAAQIVGLPYFFKNSYTIAQNLEPLSTDESLQAGDIIWIQGHALIISDVEHNRVIEAHAYDSGYGKIHEIPIENVFQGMSSLSKLQTAYKNKTALHRLNSKGIPFCTYKQFKLLRIPSTYVH